jgi:ABC-2 type transport system permease protein
VCLLRPDRHRHRHLRGDDGALGDPGPAHLFFVNPPLMALSSGFTPIEAMPKWIQPFTYLNPIAHFAGLARAVMVRGSELDVVYVQLLALGVIASVLVGVSAWKFRGQMS